MPYLYDLYSAVASQVQSLVQGALLLGQFGQGELERRLCTGLGGGVDDTYFADLAQLLQQRRQRTLDPQAIQFTPQQAAEHQRQHAVEDVDLDLLVRPMPLWPQRQMLDMLQVAERRLHVVLAPIATHHLGVRPVRAIREQERLAQPRGLQLLPSLLAEAVTEDRQPLDLGEVDLEETLQVVGGHPSLHCLSGARQR